VVYRGQYKRPPFPPKIDFGGPNYRLQRLMMHLMLTGPAGLYCRLDRPGRTPSTCVAWQLQHYYHTFGLPSYLNTPGAIEDAGTTRGQTIHLFIADISASWDSLLYWSVCVQTNWPDDSSFDHYVTEDNDTPGVTSVCNCVRARFQ